MIEADAKAGNKIRFGHAVEGHYGQLWRQRRQRDVLQRIDYQPVVDFIGDEHQSMARRDFGNSNERIAAADGASGIIRIDDNDGASAVVHAAGDVIEIGLPAVLLVALVGDGSPPRFTSAAS